MKRKPGYYNVKISGEWKIAEYCNNGWYLCGVEDKFEDYEFEEINEARIKSPDENSKQ